MKIPDVCADGAKHTKYEISSCAVRFFYIFHVAVESEKQKLTCIRTGFCKQVDMAQRYIKVRYFTYYFLSYTPAKREKLKNEIQLYSNKIQLFNTLYEN